MDLLVPSRTYCIYTEVPLPVSLFHMRNRRDRYLQLHNCKSSSLPLEQPVSVARMRCKKLQCYRFDHKRRSNLLRLQELPVVYPPLV